MYTLPLRYHFFNHLFFCVELWWYHKRVCVIQRDFRMPVWQAWGSDLNTQQV